MVPTMNHAGKYEPANCLEYGIWVALGCFAKLLFLFLSGRVGLEIEKRVATLTLGHSG